jgi:hypothetical protein
MVSSKKREGKRRKWKEKGWGGGREACSPMAGSTVRRPSLRERERERRRRRRRIG